MQLVSAGSLSGWFFSLTSFVAGAACELSRMTELCCKDYRHREEKIWKWDLLVKLLRIGCCGLCCFTPSLVSLSVAFPWCWCSEDPASPPTPWWRSRVTHNWPGTAGYTGSLHFTGAALINLIEHWGGRDFVVRVFLNVCLLRPFCSSALIAIFMLLLMLLCSCQWRWALKLTLVLKKTLLLLLFFSLQLVIKMLVALSGLCNPLFQSDQCRFPVAPWIICHWFPVSSAREKRKLCSDFYGSCSEAKLDLQCIYFSYQTFTSGFEHLFLCLHVYKVSAGH